MQHAPTRLGLLGLGRMGRVHLAALRQHLPDIRLVSVGEPRAEAVEAAADLVGDAEVFPNAEALLAQSELDGCVVVLPTDLHGGVVEAALTRGVAVFCEKPLTLQRQESESLAALAQERDLVLQVGFWRRYCPPFSEAKAQLASGVIGEPLFVRCAQWDIDCPPAEWCDPERSGGVFVDMAVHEFDQLEWLLDRSITRVEARTLPRVKAGLASVGDYDNALVLVELGNVARGLIDLSRNGRYADDVRLEVLGSNGAILVETWPKARVRVGTREGLHVVWEGEAEDAFLQAVAGELAAFSLALTDKDLRGSVPGAQESIRATDLGAAARRSAGDDGAPIGTNAELAAQPSALEGG